MPILKVPSLQHLSRNWKPDSGMISRDLVGLVRSPPRFSYRAVFSATQDLLQFGQPLDQVLEGIRRAEQREKVRDNFLELIPLIANHFSGVRPDFVSPVSTRIYNVGPGLSVPFTPPLVYGVGGQLYFPWFSFWRRNPIKDRNLRLFVTLVYEVLHDDPDLDAAIFQILDFSCPKASDARSLSVKSAAEIEPLPHEEKVAMLEVFAEGFHKAKSVLEADPVKAPREDRDEDDNYDDSLQMGFPF